MRTAYRSFFLLLSIILLSCCKSKKGPNIDFTEFEIGIIADCQYCDCEAAGPRYYRKSPDRLRKAVKVFNEHNLEYSIHLGDFIDKHYKSFDSVVPVWNSLKSRGYHVLGNHDFSVADSLKPVLFQKMNMQDRYYSLVRNNWRFIMLDGNDLSTYGSLTEIKKRQTDSLFNLLSDDKRPNLKMWNGGLSNEQLSWVEHELDLATQQNQNVGFYCHFPALGVEQALNLWNYDQFLDLIDKYDRVKFYFNGHNHAGGYVQKNGVHFLNFKGMVETEDATAFAVVAFRKDSLWVRGFGREPSRSLKIK